MFIRNCDLYGENLYKIASEEVDSMKEHRRVEACKGGEKKISRRRWYGEDGFLT